MTSKNPYISVVIPTYNCEQCLLELYRRLVLALDTINENFELIMINDASPQNDWNIILSLAKEDYRVKGINLSRNFGQQNAISAGLSHSSGEWVVVMDGDLQDRPEEIVKMHDKALEGYDIVFARRFRRQDSLLKKLYSHSFSLVFNYLSDIAKDSSIGNFSICSRKVIQNICEFREHSRSYPFLLVWVGFTHTYVDVLHSDRFAGQTSYNFRKGLNLAIDTIIAYSNKPLRLSIKLGFSIAALAFIYGAYQIANYIIWSETPSGWTSIIVSLYFIGGMIFANMGVLGLYIGKMYDELKNRPIYIEKEQINIH